MEISNKDSFDSFDSFDSVDFHCEKFDKVP